MILPSFHLHAGHAEHQAPAFVVGPQLLLHCGHSHGPFQDLLTPAAVTLLVRPRRRDLYNIQLAKRADAHCWLVCFASDIMAGRRGRGQGPSQGGVRMSLASPGPGVKGASFWTPNRDQTAEAGPSWQPFGTKLCTCKIGDLGLPENLSFCCCLTKNQLHFHLTS